MCKESFLVAFSCSNDLIIVKLPTISEYSKETFFLGSVFAEVRNSGMQGFSVREKGTVSQRFFGIFEILKHPFLSEHF